MLFWFVD